MKHYYSSLFFLIVLLVCGCSTDTPVTEEPDPDAPVNEDPMPDPPEIPEDRYYPPIGSDTWESIDPELLGWNMELQDSLLNYLENKGTKGFMILKNGRIALEVYFNGHARDSSWYWASAGKTLTAYMVGIAQQQGKIDIKTRASEYLGVGWTSIPGDKEFLIKVENQLNMTSGLQPLNFDCVTPQCLTYVADAGTRWAYHNGPYTLLQRVVSNAVNAEFEIYFNNELRNKIGMNGFWATTNGLNNVYFSTTRSMARFGLLNLNNGTWDDIPILTDMEFEAQMRTPSQELNRSYGYLYWLNGQPDFMAPASQIVFTGPLIPSAPMDLYSGLGKNDQKLYIVPSEELVIVRMGEDTGENLLGPSSFDNALWELLSAYMQL